MRQLRTRKEARKGKGLLDESADSSAAAADVGPLEPTMSQEWEERPEHGDGAGSEEGIDSDAEVHGGERILGDYHDGGHDGCVVCERASQESVDGMHVSYEIDEEGSCFQLRRWTLVPDITTRRISPQGDGVGERSCLEVQDLAEISSRYP